MEVQIITSIQQFRISFSNGSYNIALDVHAQLSPPLGPRWSKDFTPKFCIDTYSLVMGKTKQNPNAIYE
jgi:hypothetical protein